MVFKKKGRWAEFQVLHRHLRGRREEGEVIKIRQALGLMRLGQVYGGEFTHLATQNRVKKEVKSVSSPPPLALEW
jgi:hypothetical protein